jgi:hypothetical protein
MPDPNEASLAGFMAALDLYEQGIVTAVNQFSRLVALDLHQRIVEKTPVDTGLARNSWDISPFTVEAPRGGLARSGGRLLTGWSIVNTLPYIENLELGSSRQAPAGMVRVSLVEVELMYDGVEITSNLGDAP